MNKSKLIIVSNRLPISVSKENGELRFSESSGGLATAMKSLEGDQEKLWIGWPGINADDLTPSDKRTINKHLSERGFAPVYLTASQVADFYDGYSNDTLWPLFHYFESVTRHDKNYWKAYQSVNQIVARTIKKYAEPEDTIWIQDYHLMLLPQLIRADVPTATIGFFLHIPFPSFELFRLLPERKEILRGLLGADLIGFHIYDYARHFLSSCTRLLGLKSKNGVITHDGRQIKVDSFPIGIDYAKFKQTTLSKEVAIEATRLREHYRNQKIILSVDRLDYTKGIVHRLDAFEQFLRDNPRFHRKVCLVMVAVPSRIKVETYQNLRDAVEKTVSRINGQFGSVDWTPISYQFQNLPFNELVALYAEAEVALVTPLRDGMNLVAKEYIASKQKKSGVLILSEMAGAIDEMPEAIGVNPNDKSSIATAIKTALTMPKKEQRVRLDSIQRRISRYTVQQWGGDFLSQLQLASDEQRLGNVKNITRTKARDIKKDYTQAKKRVLLLDYDGTLKSFTSSLNLLLSRPPKKLMDMLTDLADQPNTSLYIVSGRDKKNLESWFGNTNLSLVAEHGAWIKTNGEWRKTDALFDKEKKLLKPVMHRFADRTPGSRVEEKDFSLVWHYRDVPTELAYIRTVNLKHALKPLVKDTNIGMFDGNKIVELKLLDITKGHAARTICETEEPDFILCIGDDYTDEDMFRSLPSTAHTVHVGHEDTDARYTLPDVTSVHTLLDSLRD